MTKRNQSVHKAAAILRAAAAQPAGETASGLARAAGLPHPTALRLIHTLDEEGFLMRRADGRYAIGADLRRLAGGADLAEALVAAARRPLAELAGETRETATLAIPRGSELEIVFQVDGPHMIRTVNWVGGRYPLHATAGGKVLLATWSQRRRDAFLRTPLEGCASRTVTDPDALRREVERVGREGHSEIVDELEDGLAAIGVPVFGRDGLPPDGDGPLLGVVNVNGPSFRFDAAARERAVSRALATARAIEGALRPAAGTARPGRRPSMA